MPKNSAPCSIDGCDRARYANGKCEAHSRREYRRRKGGGEGLPLDAPVNAERNTRDLHRVSTRVSAETFAALERAGGAYSAASALLEAWASGEPPPKLGRRKRAA